jgi:sulfur carrier protein
MPLEIIVNGESRITPILSVLDYLRTLEIDPSRVAVELNLDILPKGEYATTLLKQGDRLEIVQFVGGG